jgi:hypothetical protein
MLRAFEPEIRDRIEHAALVGNRVGQHDVEADSLSVVTMSMECASIS